ncbi:MAG: hypothetical protein ACOX2U_02930 [Limisphaerales bacterium]|jgi:hypothetical protein
MKLSQGRTKPHRNFLCKRVGGKWLAVLVLCIFLIGWSLPTRGSESVSELAGVRMENFDAAFGLNARGWSIRQSACSLGANLLWPGETAAFTFFIKPETPYHGTVKLEVNRYGTRSRSEAPGRPVIFLMETLGTTELEARIPAEGGFVTFTPEIGERFGGYLLVLELEGRGRAFGASVVRALEAEAGPVFEPTFSIDLPEEQEISPLLFNALRKLGVRGARLRSGYDAFPQAVAEWALANEVALPLDVNGGAQLRTEEQIAALWASRRASGYENTAATLHLSSILTPANPPTSPPTAAEQGVLQAWAPAAAVAAAQKWIGQRGFREILFKNGLPWVYVFDGLRPHRNGQPSGRANPEDGTVVIVGDLKELYRPDCTPFRSVKMNAGASFSLENPRDEFRVYDFYGNRLESVAARITLPLNGSGYILRSDGRRGSFRRLLKAVEAAEIRNVDPVQIVVYDFAAPVLQPKTTLKIRISNVLNRTVEGRVQALVPGIVFEKEDFALKLRAGQSRELELRIVPHLSQERDGNNYPLIIAWNSPEASIQHAETIHVQWLARHTPQIDGRADDWKELLPLSTFTPLAEPDPTQPYEPFRDWPLATERETVSGWIAWDDDYFYFAARTPGFRPMPRFSYRQAPGLPSGAGQHNVQIAFNLSPQKNMPAWGGWLESVYEFALNLCEDGGSEIFCLSRPVAPRRQFYPRQPVGAKGLGPLGDDSLLVIRGGFCECAIPWHEIPEVRDSILKGKPLSFSYRVNAGERAWELPLGRSASREIPPDLSTGSFRWANQLPLGIEPAPKK